MDVFDLEIGMIAKRGISEFEDITPLMEPLACCLRSSCLSTHCSSCFRLLDDDNMSSPYSNGFLRYCSSQCYDADQPIFSKSGELELFNHLKDNPDRWLSEKDDICFHDESFLRLALRLLLLLPDDIPIQRNGLPFQFPRIFGLSSNDPLLFVDIDTAGYLLSHVRCLRDGTNFPGYDSIFLEMNAFTLVLTNALRVSLGNDLKPVGIALYDWRVSWINHSCSPNSYVRFVDAFQAQAQAHPHHDIELAIEPLLTDLDGLSMDVRMLKGVSAPRTVTQIPFRGVSYGPRAAVQTIHPLQQGEEVKITYIDISQPKLIRRTKLRRDYQFLCACRRCTGLDRSKGEDNRLLPLPEEEVIAECFMMRDYQFLCKCRRCVGLDTEWENVDPDRCLAEKLVLSVLETVEPDDDQDIVPKGPSITEGEDAYVSQVREE